MLPLYHPVSSINPCDWRNKLPYVLVIDDEIMILDLVKQALTRLDYRVETTQSAADGIHKFSSENFDLVITDVCMPGIDGNSVLDRIRRSPKSKIPVIGISGTPWMLNNEAFDLILPKPFTIRSLTEGVQALIGLADSMDSGKVVIC